MKYILICCLLVLSCKAQIEPKTFSEEALADTFITLDDERISFKDILAKYEGKTIVIEVWASWCKDCILGLPKTKKLQEEYKDVVFLFLSLDKGEKRWKKGIDKYNVIGEHYFMQSGWKGDFGDFVDLDWIPRYMVVTSKGDIKLFKAIKADDSKLIKALQ